MSHREDDRHLEVVSVKSDDGYEMVLERFDDGDDDERTLNVYSPEGELVMYISGFYREEERTFLRLLKAANFSL